MPCQSHRTPKHIGFKEACFSPGVCLARMFPANGSIKTGEAPAVPARQSCIEPDVLEVVVGSGSGFGIFRAFRSFDGEF